jgi:small nuclear ribonucleoprotein (snRNP)-like protein
MNIAMEQCEEINASGNVINRYGDVFIRGNNGNVFFYI